MSADSAARSIKSAARPRPARLSDRVLAEAAVALERLDASAALDPDADAAGRAAQGDAEDRIIARARSLRARPAIQEALTHVRSALGLVMLGGVIIALIAGAGAARAALASPRDEPVNVFLALGTTLGVQSIFLLLWIGLMLIDASRKNREATALGSMSLGGLALRLAQSIAGRLHRGPAHAAAIAAVANVHLRGRLAMWTFSSISHLLWLVFNIATLVVLILLLSARQYTFAWETTILSERQFIPFTEAISALPHYAGFITPRRDQIESSQWPFVQRPDATASQAWSGLLIGSIVLYGFAPRLLLLGWSLGRRRAAAAAYRLDLSQSGFVQWLSRIMPAAQSTGVIDGDDGQTATSLQRIDVAPRPLGPPAILAFEMPEPLRIAWPPALHQVRWLDLGMVDTRDDRHRVLDVLRRSETEPATVAVVFALTATPDRGAAAFLSEVRSVLSRPVTVVLTAGEALRKRTSGVHVTQRIEDWKQSAINAGVNPERIVDVDLDHLTQASASRLANAVVAEADMNRIAGSTPPSTAQRNIEAAFDLIVTQSEEWFGEAARAPTVAEQVELHRQIARLYQHEQQSWRDLIRAPQHLGKDLINSARDSAARMVDLLPTSLRQSFKWIAAGAAAGALGCVAAATLLTPVAITALPMWSAIGGGISGVLAMSRKSYGAAEPEMHSAPVEEIAEAIRAAALFAMLLEVQGRDETVITRVLERALVNNDNARNGEELNSPDAAHVWLEDLRHRLDLALAREASA